MGWFLIGSLLDHYNRLNDNFDQSWYDHDDDGDNECLQKSAK